MHTLVNGLAQICRDYPLERKRLVVSSQRSGHQLLESLAREDVSWLNLSPVTPLDLAREIAEPRLVQDGVQVIDSADAYYLVHETVEEMKAAGELQYFAALEGLQGPAGVLQGPLLELRRAGIGAADLDPDSFVDGQKGREVRALLQGYEQRLEDGDLADEATLLHLAMAVLEDSGPGAAAGALYLIPEQLEFDYLSYSFLEMLTHSRRVVLPEEPVRGLECSRPYVFSPERKPQPASPFSYLFAPGEAPDMEEPELELFRAYGPACEVKEVFRRLQRDEVPLDQALLCYTGGFEYLPLIHTVAEAHGIPVTFEEGVPALFNRPGRLLAGLLDWMGENHASSHLYRLLMAGCLGVRHPVSLAGLLRRAQVGWGRERYRPCLDGLRDELEERRGGAQAEGDDDRACYWTGQLERFSQLHQLVEDLLEQVPAPDEDNRLPMEDLCAGLGAVIGRYSPTACEADRAAREAILEMLEGAARSYRERVENRTATRRLRALLKELRAGAAAAAPGHLHVAPVGRGEWVQRQRTFVVGLGGDHFPGVRLQEPVLLDAERQSLSGRLLDNSANPERNLYRLNRFLAGRRGPVTLSYSAFEPVQGRPSFPASALLQAHRLQNRRPEDDYSNLFAALGPCVAYYPAQEEKALSVYEWWLSQAMAGRGRGEADCVRNCYPGIDAGLAAQASRREERFTEYDGKVPADPARLDPRRNPDRTVSPSSLENLAGCPFAYFLQYVLGVKAPEEPSFDRWAWLDPATRGTLLHRIYAAYWRQAGYRSAPDPGELERLQDLAEAEIRAMRQEVPPPSEMVFQRERKDLLRGLPVFLRLEEELRQEGHEPLGLEVPFGLGSEAMAQAGGLGREEPVWLSLPGGGAIRLRGRIDRIDRLPEPGEYQVWDYKTGSSYGRSRTRPLQKGRQLQPFLYALAAEAILSQRDPEARVVDTGYLFPTEKGEGQLLRLGRGPCARALEAVDLMLDLVASGAFPPAQDKQACSFCDYGSVCRHPRAVEDMKAMVKDPANEELQPWKELQNYG